MIVGLCFTQGQAWFIDSGKSATRSAEDQMVLRQQGKARSYLDGFGAARGLDRAIDAFSSFVRTVTICQDDRVSKGRRPRSFHIGWLAHQQPDSHHVQSRDRDTTVAFQN